MLLKNEVTPRRVVRNRAYQYHFVVLAVNGDSVSIVTGFTREVNGVLSFTATSSVQRVSLPYLLSDNYHGHGLISDEEHQELLKIFGVEDTPPPPAATNIVELRP